MKNINERGDVCINEYGEYDKISVKGNLECKSKIKVNNLDIKGEINSELDIESLGKINLKGKANLNNIDCNYFKIHGRIKANEIRGNDIKVISSRNSYIKCLHGKEILIKNGTNTEENTKVMNFILDKLNIDLKYEQKKEDSIFKIDEIYGGRIELHNIEVNTIIADELILHGKCIIDKVICKGNIEKSNDSVIKKESR